MEIKMEKKEVKNVFLNMWMNRWPKIWSKSKRVVSILRVFEKFRPKTSSK